MTMVIAWLVFPLLLAALCLGCGLLLQRAAGTGLPQPLLLPAGFVVISIATQFAHMSDATARFETPLVVALALAGFALAFPWRRPKLDGWWVAAGIGVFAVFAAPVVLSGRATFAGFIKLDDTANYLAMLDRGVHHGYNVAGLAPSTYQAFLSSLYVFGYPLGSLLPLGVGSSLLGRDAAWLWQPYLTFLAAMIALGLYQLAAEVIRSRRLRALVAFVGAQAALIYGYALWGGIKELATTVVIVLIAALAPAAVRQGTARAVLPMAGASAALVGILSVGGAAWLAPLLVGALALAVFSTGLRTALKTSAAFVAAAGVLAVPALVAAATWLPHSGAFTSGGEYGNLRGSLSWLQVFGVWLHGDFRTPPKAVDHTYALIAIVAVAAIIGVALAWRRKAWGFLLAVSTATFAAVFYVGLASPWVGDKALASSSPVVLAVALVGAAAVFEGGRRVEGAVAAAFIVGGVLSSNALQYHDVFLAPSSRLAELASIGHRFSSQGPALMTEYEEYGSRHFLRTLDAEGAGELRRHFDYLRTGGTAAKGVSPDIDELQLASVLYYRTLVLRRSGVGSRPPSTYRLVWSGRYYEVWQRPENAPAILEHLSLGSRLQPAAVPSCADVLRLAHLAAADNGELAAVERPPAIVIEPDGTIGAPTSFDADGEDPHVLYPYGPITLNLRFTVSQAATYGVWIGGSFRSELIASVDGTRVGNDRDELNWPGNFTGMGSIQLGAGTHVLQIRYTGPDLWPGSAGLPPWGLGPFAVAEGTEDRSVTYLRPSEARALCGKSLDWVEAVKR
jgi:hypothetical protein